MRLDRFEPPADPFRRLRYRLEPDYGDPPPEIPPDAAARIRRRIEFLYGPARAPAVCTEISRLMRVHLAHTTPELREAERHVDPTERFTERDVVLITYGDLVVSSTRSPLRTLADFTKVFFQGLVTTLHILPFYPHSSDRGFSVVSYEEVDPTLGSWDEIAELSAGFRLMFDAVFNHVSSKSYWFQQFLNGNPEYQDWFVVFSSKSAVSDDLLRLVMRPRATDLLSPYATIDGRRYVWTTFSRDQVDLNFKNPTVLIRVLDILLLYVRRGADLLRLDAVTYLWSELGTSCAHLEQTHAVVKLMRDVLDAVAPHVALVTETNVPHADNITYFGDGTDEAQMVYNFALPPLVLHAFQTGNAEKLSRWAATLDLPSARTCFLNFLDSHDGIGLMGARGLLSEEEIRAMCDRVLANGGLVSLRTGEDGSQTPYELNITWFSALNGTGDGEPVARQVDRFIASRVVALLIRGVPGIYLPSFFGSTNDLDAVYRDGSNRSINRSEIVEERLFDAFADSAAAQTQVARRYLALLERRTVEPAFHPNVPQRVLRLAPRVFALARLPPHGAPIVGLVNVSDAEVGVSLASIALELGAAVFADLLTGGRFRADRGPIALPPYGVLWLKPDRG